MRPEGCGSEVIVKAVAVWFQVENYFVPEKTHTEGQ